MQPSFSQSSSAGRFSTSLDQREGPSLALFPMTQDTSMIPSQRHTESSAQVILPRHLRFVSSDNSPSHQQTAELGSGFISQPASALNHTYTIHSQIPPIFDSFSQPTSTAQQQYSNHPHYSLSLQPRLSLPPSFAHNEPNIPRPRNPPVSLNLSNARLDVEPIDKRGL